MDYGDQVRVVNKDNVFVGLEGRVSVVLGELILVDTDGDDAGSFAFYIDELEVITH